MYKIARENLPALCRAMAAGSELYLPVQKNGQVNFAPWEESVDEAALFTGLETLKTVKSPKDIFFPQSETLYTCKKDGKKLTVEPEAWKDQDFVVFGMKACDLQGLKVLDQVFLSDPVDTFYAARRQHGTIVALGCKEPETSCFCRLFGTDCTEPAADVAVWLTDAFLFWKPLTEKGEALTARLKEDGPLARAGEEDNARVEAEKAATRRIVERLPYSHLSLEGWNGDATDEKFGDPLWEELYKPCLACGTCTFVCPTCQCYDIKDYDTGHGIQRYRCWDSCMYSDFTMMAAANNRTSQMQRFRQRFMHKLVYFPANNDGMYSCVGCGRCVDKCPASLNIVKVIKAFAAGEKATAAKADGPALEKAADKGGEK
ncbi:MAG: 4Fe-4S ferredoxin [Lachnospiraceae bacterium]|nr:4Fe-4S ferredoxin [Lachnospiraceae bacterium]